MKSHLAIGLLLVAALVPPAGAQLRMPYDQNMWRLDATSQEDGAAAAPQSGSPVHKAEPPSDGLRLHNAALIAGGALLVTTYGMIKWWDQGFTGRFRTHDEGWFGQDTSSGGADKLGHAFTVYAGTRLMARGFEAVGNERGRALTLGFWSSVGIMTAIEVADGYSKQYRFSTQDAVMNLVGAGVGYLAETNPDLDRLVDLRLLYNPSGSSYDPAGDYSGQTYLLVLKASGVSALREREPLRYLEFAAGYGTRGYGKPAGFDHTRNIYVGVSLNLAEVLAQTVFRGSSEHSTARRASDLFFEYIQVPGTAALARQRL